MQVRTERKISLFGCAVAVGFAITVLSQLPVFVEGGMTNRLSIPVWLCLFCVALIKSRGVLPAPKSAFLLPSVIALALFYLISAIFNSAYLESSLPYVVLVAMFVWATGWASGNHLNRADLSLISKSYIFSSVVLAVVVYFTYFWEAGADSPIYLYEDKNSTGQILMTAVILIIVQHLNEKNAKLRLLYMGCMVILIAMMLLMRSRATIIFFPVLVYLLLTSQNTSKGLKWATVAVTVLIAVVLIFNGQLREQLLQEVIYAQRDETNLNALSSGRWAEWQNFLSDFADKWLFGHGRMKRESVILTALLEYGLIFGSLILLVAAYPLYFALCRLPKTHPNRALLLFVSVCYLLNGVFEQLAPFGPGVKCFFLWFLLGVLSCPFQCETEEVCP